MKLPVILTFILTLGFGIAVGSYFAPEVRQVGAFFKLAPDESPGTLHRNDDSPNAANRYASSSGVSPSSASDNKELTSILSDTDTYRQTRSLLAYTQSLSPEQVPNAIHEIQKHPVNGKDQALILLIGHWVEIDPQGARNAISTIQDGQARFLLIRGVYSALAIQDPSNAISLAQQLPIRQQRDQAMQAIVQKMAQQDPIQALALYKNSKSLLGSTLGSIFAEWADKNLGQATQAALQSLNTAERYTAIQSMVIRLVQKDPQSAMTWIEELPPGEAQNMGRENLISHLANNDPQAAAVYIRGLQQVPADVQDNLVRNVAIYWSQTDPKAAASWAESLPPSQSSKNALQITLASWARNDPKAALDFLNALPRNPDDKVGMFANVASQWAISDPQGVLTWANQLPEGKSKDASLRNAIEQWAANDPVKAAAYIQTMPDGKIRQDEVGRVVVDWANSDPASAAQWVAKLPDTPQKNEIYSNLASTWAKNSPVEASNWLTQLPSGPSRDAAVRSFSNQIVSGDPNSAYQWAESIGDPSARQNQVLEVLRKWQAFDPTAATAAAQRSPLTPEQKSSFLQSSH